MLSKLTPFDYANKFKNGIDISTTGIKSIFIEDPYLEKIIKDKIPKDKFDWRIYSGNELTKSFIEDQFLNLSLFSNPQNLFILQGETIPQDVLTIIYNEIEFDNDSTLVIFYSKLPKAYSDIIKKSKVETFEVTNPNFWEGPKVLSFCLKELDIKLTGEVQKFLLDNSEHNFESFIQNLKLIQLNYPAMNPSLNELRNLISRERYDFFELIDLYHANRSKLFLTILDKSNDYEWLRSFFTSMQSHLVKILFPTEIAKKEKPSKYEQNILRLTETSSRKDLKLDLNLFLELEIWAKSKDEFLKDKIRLEIK